jgi:predicted SAM-dependent methyltransferase
MLKENEIKILKNLKENDRVLDIGGWDKPFNRANVILDVHSYETRGFHGSQGGDEEYFNKRTWIIHDVSSRKKLPFTDNYFDFVICSHILEDIRDPIWLCSEILRISKAGYIEVPSMKVELGKGIMNKNYAGYYHHRWLVEIKDKKIIFRFKPHFIHNDKRFHFSNSFVKRLKDNQKVDFLFWNKKFEFEERVQISRDKSEEFIYNFIKINNPNKIKYFLLDLKEKTKIIKNSIKKKFFPEGYYHKYMDTEEIISK